VQVEQRRVLGGKRIKAERSGHLSEKTRLWLDELACSKSNQRGRWFEPVQEQKKKNRSQVLVGHDKARKGSIVDGMRARIQAAYAPRATSQKKKNGGKKNGPGAA
jgi:hypothetical protein